MTDTIQVVCENIGQTLDVPMGTPLAELARDLESGPRPFLAATVDNRLKELNYRISTPVTVRF
ncbi:MAG: nucleoside kinase, partial [Alistipes sp.]|nr:nucleoside kinase [Alistipes sp.]